MIVVLIVLLAAATVIVLMQIHSFMLLRKLCELFDDVYEETPRDKENKSYERQWNALMTYRGDANGETKKNSDE